MLFQFCFLEIIKVYMQSGCKDIGNNNFFCMEVFNELKNILTRDSLAVFMLKVWWFAWTWWCYPSPNLIYSRTTGFSYGIRFPAFLFFPYLFVIFGKCVSLNFLFFHKDALYKLNILLKLKINIFHLKFEVYTLGTKI